MHVSAILHHKVIFCPCDVQGLSVVGILQDEADPMVSVMKVQPCMMRQASP